MEDASLRVDRDAVGAAESHGVAVNQRHLVPPRAKVASHVWRNPSSIVTFTLLSS